MIQTTACSRMTLGLAATILGLGLGASLSVASPQTVSISRTSAEAPDRARNGIVPVRIAARMSSDSLVPVLETSGSAAGVGDQEVIALNLRGAPLRFAALTRDHQRSLVERFGADAPRRYEIGLSRELKKLVSRFQAQHPTARVGMVGVPFVASSGGDAAANGNYSGLIGSLDVLMPGVDVSADPERMKALSELARGRQIVPVSSGLIERNDAFANARRARQSDGDSVRPSRDASSGADNRRGRRTVRVGGSGAYGNRPTSDAGGPDLAWLEAMSQQDAMNGLLSAWGASGSQWDLNGDGFVDGHDLSIVLGHYGEGSDSGGDSGGDGSDDGDMGGGGQSGGGGTDGGAGGGTGGDPGEGVLSLVPGPGFMGATSVPGRQGSPSAPGYQAQAIARWTELPYITRDRDFYVTISAFHMAEIDRVEFILNGGEPVVTREVQPHPDTGYAEYMVKVDVSDLTPGLHEIRAIAYPRTGQPRVLQGETDRSGIHMVNNGNESFWFNYDPSPTTAWVGPNSQYPTIDAAIAALGEDLYGGRIYLSEGSHDLFDQYNSTFQNTDENKVLTISSAPGLDATKVFIEGYAGPGDGVLRNASLHIKDVSVLAPVIDHQSAALKGFGPHRLILEGVYNTSTDPVRGWAKLNVQRLADAVAEWTLGCWMKDCSLVNVPKGPKSVTMAKNVSYTRISADAFPSGPGAVINCWLDKADPYNADHQQHADIFQLSVTYPVEILENRILADVRATNNTNQIGHITGVNEIKNFAIVRWEVDSMYSGSSMNLFRDIDHLVIDDCTFRNCAIAFGGRFTNTLVRDTLMYRWRDEDRGFDALFDADTTIIDGLHFEDESNPPFPGTTTGLVHYAAPSPPVGVPSSGGNGFIPTYVMSDSLFSNQYIGNADVERRGTIRDHFYYDRNQLDLTWWR